MTKRTRVCRDPITIADPDIVIEVKVSAEELPIEGNALPPTESEIETRAEEKRIADALAGGNAWAWCAITVRVTYREIIWAQAERACCSYQDETEFREDSEYSDMIQSCLVEINNALDVLWAPKGGK